MDEDQPRDDDTQRLDVTIEDDPPRWTASARVPVAEPPAAGPADEVRPDGYPDPSGDRNWLTPLLYGFLGLVLLGVLLAGVWLISKADDDNRPASTASPAPTASPTAPPFSAAPGPTAPTKETTQPAPPVATRAAESTTRPEPTTAADGSVPVPAVVGLAEDEARQRLSDAGLRFEVTRQPDANHAPGTVLSVSPGPGTSVASNSVVRLVVASAPQNAP